MLKQLLDKFRKGKVLAYDEAKILADSEDVSVRREVALNKTVKPEILYFLASDTHTSVREAIAENPATPSQADLLLTNDDDENVRRQLAAKISAIAPGLTADEVDTLKRCTYQALEKLARDQAVKVRQIVAETLKDMADAPAEVIRHLAKDSELVVCAPVLGHSTVLSERDLIQIIKSSPVDGAMSAIANRDILSDVIMEEIFAANDTAAVNTLLKNASVQIKENLLERICDKSKTVTSYQSPLVYYPTLPSGVALRLADFVADHLIESMLNRNDLDPVTAKAVRAEVSSRLDDAAEDEASKNSETPIEKVTRLHNEGNLSPEMVESALKAGQKDYASAALSILAGINMGTVNKIIESSTPKGLVALSWKAGLTAQNSVTVQQRLGRIQPIDVLKPSNSEYAMKDDEMEWQLEFFEE